MWTAIDADAKQPFRELAEDFRGLAAEAEGDSLNGADEFQAGLADAFQQAAQMLEERLNG